MLVSLVTLAFSILLPEVDSLPRYATRLVKSSFPVQYVKDNSSIILSCPYKPFTNPVIKWTRNAVQIHPGFKYKLKHPYELQVLNVNIYDEATYTCYMYTKYGEETYSFSLYVNADIENITRVSQNVNAYQGSSVRLDCTAADQPKPDIIWMKDNIQLKPDQHRQFEGLSLHLVDLQPADEGEYTCLVHNRYRLVQQTYILTVLGEGMPIVTVSTDEMWSIGKPAALKCTVKSRYHPKIIWLREISMSYRGNNTVLLDGLNYRILPSKHLYHGDTVYVSVLSVTDLQPPATGRYVCVAMNVMGSRHLDIMLNFTGSCNGSDTPYCGLVITIISASLCWINH